MTSGPNYIYNKKVKLKPTRHASINIQNHIDTYLSIYVILIIVVKVSQLKRYLGLKVVIWSHSFINSSFGYT